MSTAAAAQLPRGVIVELDYAVLPGHALMQDLCMARFSREKLDVDLKTFSRCFGGKTFSAGLNALCNKLEKRVDVPSVVAECQGQFAEALHGALGEIPDGFRAFVKALVAKQIRVVLITRLESEGVQQVFDTFTPEQVSVLHDAPASFCFTNWEGWRRVARKSNLHERLCLAVVGSGFSVKGALTSGFSVMVRTNPLTAYQDVGGSDLRINDYTAALAEDVVCMLRA